MESRLIRIIEVPKRFNWGQAAISYKKVDFWHFFRWWLRHLVLDGMGCIKFRKVTPHHNEHREAVRTHTSTKRIVLIILVMGQICHASYCGCGW